MIESGEIYKLIVENVNDLVAVINQDIIYEYMNENVHEKLTGYSSDDLLGKKVLNFVHIEDHKKVLYEFDKTLETGIHFTEIRFKHKEGHLIWIETNGKQFIDKDGKTKVLTISRDITERKIAEEKLRERVKELSSIYKLSKLLENPTINIEGIFQGTLALIPSAFQFPDIICARILYKNKVYSTINFEITDWKFSTKGMINQNEMVIEIYYLEEKAFIKGEHDLIGDFFLRLKSSIEERETKKKLKESEEKYRIISENAYDLIIMLNQKFKYEYINENAFQQILGYSKEDLLGKSALKYAHPDDVPNTTRILFDGFNRGRGEAEYRLKHKDGHWLWFEGKGKTFSDNDGDLKAIIISRDITERKLAEQKLKQSENKYRKAYNRANFYKDIFGHDINNILHIINYSAELISYHLGGSEKSKVIDDISNIIKNQVERGAKLVANINILSQLEEEDMQTQPTDVCRLMRNSIDFINNAYNDREIKIDDACEKDHLIANANELLQDVFDNILINSSKYNEHPNIEISIKASKILVDDTNFIKMEFSDNGIGVPDDRKEIIFKRGNRELKGSKGMGIGLSLVKKIMKGYNGKIWVEDKVKGDFSKGSNFILLIPEIVEI